MFTEAVFTLAKIGKQPKCPLMDERIKKDVTVIHTYNGILLSHKKEWYSAICNNMDGPRDYHTNDVNQKEKDKYHMISLICGI